MNNSVKITITLVFSLLATNAGAQITWPTPHALSGNNYTLDAWPAASPAGTYPGSMRFYRLGTTGEPLNADTIYQDYTSAYNTTSGTRINGLDNGGVSFINTGNTAYKIGAAVLSLNTLNRNTIKISWMGKTVTPNFRSYEIRMFYRTDTVGTWNPVLNASNDTVRYLRNATTGDSITIGPINMPSSINNLPRVQICWKYFQMDTNTATGARAELSINHISVTSLGIPSPAVTTSATFLNALTTFVNTASTIDSFRIAGTNLTANVTVTAPTGFEIATSSSGTFAATATVTQSGGTLTATPIYVRFHPVTHGIFNGNISVSTTGATAQNVTVNGYTYNATNPAPFNLGSGNYSMMGWDSLATAGTYPANIMFHTSNVDAQALSSAPLMNNWTCAYNLQSRPRVIGLDTSGFSFLNTGSPQYDTCNGGTTVLNTYMGGAVLALNTTGKTNIALKYYAGTVKQGDGSVPRVYNLRLQYRTDTLGMFADMSPLADYTSDMKIEGDVQLFSMNLPAVLENKSYVQLRWLYYAVNVTGASGSRPQLRLDDITVTTLPTSVATTNKNSKLTAYPSPLKAGSILYFNETVSGRMIDMYGRTVASFSKTNVLATTNLAPGIYNIVTIDGESIRIFID